LVRRVSNSLNQQLNDRESGVENSDQGAGNLNEIASAIVFVTEEDSRAKILGALESLGVKNPVVATDEAICIDAISNSPASWLVLDMGSGVESVVRILIAAQGTSAFDVTPMLLLTPDAGYKTLCIAFEYNVSKILMGQISDNNAKSCLTSLDVVGAQNKKLDAVFRELLAFRKAGKWKEAISLIDSELEGPLKTPALFIEQAENLFLSGDLPGAAELMEDMIAKNPNDLRAVHMMSRILLAQKKVPEAIELLSQAEKKSQYSADRLIALGDCYLQMGKYRQARSKFNTALGIDETRVAAKRGLMQTELLTGNMDEALQMGKSLGSNTDIAKILNMTAIIAIHNKKIDDGLKMYEQSITLLSAHPVLGARVWFNLGLNHHRAGDLTLALNCFTAACDLDPNFAAAAQNRRVVGKKLDAVKDGSAAKAGESPQAPADEGSEDLYDDVGDDDLVSDDSSENDSAEDIGGDSRLFK
jgi:tetratricopeptide (TPR) repeat protein